MYKAMTLPRAHKETNAAASSSPGISGSVVSLEAAVTGKNGKKRTNSETISDTQSSASNASTTNRLKKPFGGSSLSLVSRSPKVAKKKMKGIIKGSKRLFRSKKESVPIAVETSLDLNRTMAAERSPSPVNDETDAEVTEISPEDWSVTTTYERVKRMSVVESVYKDGGEEVEQQEDGGDVRPTTPVTSEQDVVSDASSVPATPTADTQNFAPSSFNFRRQSSTALKEEIMRKTSSDNGAYLMSKMSKDRLLNPQDKSSTNKKDLLFKILVIGELGTGKTSIIKRYVHQFFSQHYRATIGVDFALKVLAWDADTTIRLQLWDIAGQERFGNMTRVYYKEAVGAFIVFDVTRHATFEAVSKWKADLDSKVQLPDGETIPCVLLGNKCDQPKEGIVNNQNKMDEFCKEKQLVGWFETSAKENINIDEAANCLISRIIENDKKRQLILEKEILNGTAAIAINGDKKDTKKKFCNYC